MRLKKLLIILIIMIPTVIHAGELNIVNYDNRGALILDSNGKYLLVDYYTSEGDNLSSWLKRKNISEVDLYLSFYDTESNLNIEGILNNKDIKINKIYLPDISWIQKFLTEENKSKHPKEWETCNYINEFYNYVVLTGKERGYEVVALKGGDSFNLGDATINVIWPPIEVFNADYSDYAEAYIEDTALVSMVSIDNKKFMMTGNMSSNSAYHMFVTHVDVKADILQINRNIEDCAYDDFIEAVKPLYAFYASSDIFIKKSLKRGRRVCNPSSYIKSIANYYTSNENGTITFNIKDGVISTKRCDNCYRVDVNYIDKDTKRVLDTYSSYYSSGLPFYLDAPKKEFKNYKYVDDDIEDGDAIRGDRVFTVNYEEIPVVINHKFDNNSDEAKVVMLVQKYVNDNLRSKLYLNNLNNWNALSVEYIGDTSEGKEYYLKTAVDCAGDKTCIEDATDFDSNNNQYLYNAYVVVDGNSNVKLSFEKSSLVEDDEEIGEGEVENPKTGSYISLFIILSTFVIVVVISFMVRKNKLYKIN